MRINASSVIAGQPALQIRKLLRTSSTFGWTEERIVDLLKVCHDEATRIAQTLEAEGLIERDEDGARRTFWRNTAEGNRFAFASAAKPIKRSTASKRLDEFLARVHLVNNDAGLAYRVQKVVLFGSMLSDAPDVSDVDLAVRLRPRYEDREKQWELCQRRIQAAVQEGRGFSNYAEQLCWPEIEVYRLLKARSPVISLHDLDAHEPMLAEITTRVLFEETEPEAYT